MQHAHSLRHAAGAVLLYVNIMALAGVILAARPVHAEVKILEGKNYIFSASPFLRTDVIMMENNVDLDTKRRDDRVQYAAFDYSLELDIKSKSAGPELYFKFESSGLYDYDVPVFIHNTLMTNAGKVHPYHEAELLPKVREFWADIPLHPTPFKVKGGLFGYKVGHGMSLNGYYENYSLEACAETDSFSWRFYYCWPDYSNKNLLGPYIKQEKEQGINYEHSKAYFFATDMIISLLEKSTVQPYVGLLLDLTDTKRANDFLTPTRQDVLGTVGISCDFNFDKLSLSVEAARNFGKADSSESNFDDVVHQGYAIYTDIGYSFDKFSPHSRFLFASGNKLTTDMITNGDAVYSSAKNNAFSVYSPFNTFLADSIYPDMENVPLVAMGNGWGMNYGVQKPSTFYDPKAGDNLIMFCAGFDYSITEKASVTFDWWYLATPQKGIGMYNNVPKVISPELGHEVDLSFAYKVTDNITVNMYSGVFFPGASYREERDDTGGSLFTPFVRGDGKADPAYQVEVNMEIGF